MLDENDLPHEFSLRTRQKSKLRNAFNNKMSTDLKHSRAEISKIVQSGGFLGSLLSKLVGPLMKVSIPLAKNVLAPLGIAVAASAINTRIQKKIHGSQKKFVLMKTSSRRLDQEQYIRLGYTSSKRLQDLFKTSSRRFEDVFKTSSRCLQNVFKTSSNVFKTSSRRLQDVSSS